MKTFKDNLKMISAMVLISGITTAGTYVWMHKKWSDESLTNRSLSVSDSSATSVSFFPTVTRASVTDNDFTRAAEKTVNAVVGVKSTQQVQRSEMGTGDPFFDLFFGYRGPQQQQPKAKEGYGSGVIISSDGYIVTNNHVIDNADLLTVTLNDKRQFEATLIGTDPATDIALLKIDGTDLPTVTFGASDDLKIGEWVLAVGNPFMLNSTVTAGIVSAKGRALGMHNGGKLGIESFIQTDAAVNPGNSGGALVNTAGELVGINTAIYSQTGNYAGYSFAVPSSIVSKVVTDLKQYGTVQRAVLGIVISDLNAELVKEQGLSVSEGVYIQEVSEKGAAQDAGIKKGDIIVAINNIDVKNMAQLQEQLARFRPGDTISLTYIRNGEKNKVSVVLRNSRGDTDLITKTGVESLGVTLKNLTAKELTKYGVRNGVLVDNVERGGLFARSGVREGLVIVKINDMVVKNVKEVEKAYNLLTTDRGGDREPVMFIVGVYPNGKTAYYAVDLSK